MNGKILTLVYKIKKEFYRFLFAKGAGLYGCGTDSLEKSAMDRKINGILFYNVCE